MVNLTDLQKLPPLKVSRYTVHSLTPCPPLRLAILTFAPLPLMKILNNTDPMLFAHGTGPQSIPCFYCNVHYFKLLNKVHYYCYIWIKAALRLSITTNFMCLGKKGTETKCVLYAAIYILQRLIVLENVLNEKLMILLPTTVGLYAPT